LKGDEEIVQSGIALMNTLPTSLTSDLIKFKQIGNNSGCFLVKGFPVGQIPSTPCSQNIASKTDKTSEVILSAVGSLLGDPVAYRQEKNGQLFHNLFPTKINEFTQTSEGSKVLLESHTELAFHPFSPDFLILFCLRQDPKKEACTMFLSAKKIVSLLPSEIVDTLKEPLFKTGIDEAWMQHYGKFARQKGNSKITPIFSEAPDLQLVWDQDLMQGVTESAKQAQNFLENIIKKNLEGVYLEPGDVLIIDNKRAMHSRSAFTAFYDGNDRWLQRILILRDKKVAESDIEQTRVIHTKFLE